MGPYVFPNKECPACGKALFQRKDVRCDAILIGSESISDIDSMLKICNRCRTNVRHNMMFLRSEKINTMTYNEMASSGVLFVNSKTACAMDYLHLAYLRLLRRRLAPGQEANVLELYHQGDSRLLHKQNTRDYLLHALEAFALAKRTPDEVVQFNLAYPAKHLGGLHKDFLFPPPRPVKALAFDGHFGIHRALVPGVDPKRTIMKAGSPRKFLKEHERSCSCRRKDCKRLALPQRTGGWQFVLDPDSRRILGDTEHLVNENMDDKVKVLTNVMKMNNVDVDLFIHDDVCHFESYIKKRRYSQFDSVKYYIVDVFHAPNHLCSKRKWTPPEKTRCKLVRTNIAESFNAWIRSLNFFVNGLRPHSHRFWIREACDFYNANLKDVPIRIARRTSVPSRSAKVAKRPSAGT